MLNKNLRSRGAWAGLPVLALCASTLIELTAQQPAPPAQAPTFRAGVESVAVDFLAVAKDGLPIPDLKLSELTLTVDGKVRAIASLQFIRLATSEARVGDSPAPAIKPLPLPFGSNAETDAGRSVILVIDHESIRLGNERLIRDAAGRFLASLTPRDRVGLVTLPNGRVEVDLTSDHERIRKALTTIVGHAPPPETAGVQVSLGGNACRPLPELLTFLDGLKGLDGPKTVVFISQSVPSADGDVNCHAIFQDIRKVAGAVRSRFYVIAPLSFPIDASLAVPTGTSTSETVGGVSYGGRPEGLEDLAAFTGGALFLPSGTVDDVFARVTRETSAYYLLGFDISPTERDGKTHSIALTSARDHVTIRARPEFTIAKTSSASAAPPEPRAMLRTMAAFRDLPLRAVAYAFRGSTDSKLTVVVAADSPDESVRFASVEFALADAKGRTIEWKADPKQLTTAPVISTVSVLVGTYRVRVAATDTTGRRGAVDYEFSAALTRAGPFDLGGLMVGVMRGGDFEPRFEFGADTGATAYLELYGTLDGGREPKVAIDVSGPGGDVLVSGTAKIDRTRYPGKWIATMPLSVAALAPGDYQVRATVRADGKVTGSVVRTLRRRAR